MLDLYEDVVWITMKRLGFSYFISHLAYLGVSLSSPPLFLPLRQMGSSHVYISVASMKS